MDLEKETFLRVLKGAPLSVLIGLWVHGSMDQGQLRRKTGFDEKTIRDALGFLDDLKLVGRPHYRKWALSDGFYQLPLAQVAMSESGEFPVSGAFPQVLIVDAESGNSPVSGAESGNSPVSALVDSRRSITTTTREVPPLDQTPPCPEILMACQRSGIGEPKRSALARMAHVIEAGPEYVAWHVRKVRQEGHRLGAAIWRMEQGWPMEQETAVDDRLKQQIPEHLKHIIKS